MIRTVISDLGRVLLWFDNNVFLRKLAARAGRSFEEVKTAVHGDPERFGFVLRRFPELLIFDGYVLSFELGLLKPDPAIYLAAARLRSACSSMISRRTSEEPKRSAWSGCITGRSRTLRPSSRGWDSGFDR